MIRPPPRSTLPDPLFPYPPRCRADAIARPEGKSQFLNTIADRFAVAGIPGCQSLETVSDPNPRPAILQSVHPFGERDALADFDILSFIRDMSAAVNFLRHSSIRSKSCAYYIGRASWWERVCQYG